MARSSSASAFLACVVVMMALAHGSMATNLVVGGPLVWAVNRYNDPNFYQDWVQSNFPIRSTDTLQFIWTAGDSLVRLNQPDFDTCNVQHPLAAWAAEGQLTFALAGYQNQRLYFTSAAPDHCAKGQKFFVDVYPPA